MWEFNQKQAMPAFHDHGWKRSEMTAWDGVWEGLSAMARSAFLDLPPSSRNHSGPAAMPLAGALRAVLLAAGLVVEVDANRVRVAPEAVGFGKRLHALRKADLFAPSGGDFRGYVHSCYHAY